MISEFYSYVAAYRGRGLGGHGFGMTSGHIPHDECIKFDFGRRAVGGLLRRLAHLGAFWPIQVTEYEPFIF